MYKFINIQGKIAPNFCNKFLNSIIRDGKGVLKIPCHFG